MFRKFFHNRMVNKLIKFYEEDATKIKAMLWEIEHDKYGIYNARFLEILEVDSKEELTAQLLDKLEVFEKRIDTLRDERFL